MDAHRPVEFLYAPLGGADEIGMNMYLYGHGPADDPEWVIVDFGITFADGSPPGVDVILPDPGFIVERRDRLRGIVLTHAHEDHLGAIPYLWRLLRCPIWASPFAASVLRRKLRDDGIEVDSVPITVVDPGERFKVGPFMMELIGVTHSIPDSNALAIRGPLGSVLHTGDWKLDPAPVVGEATDEKGLGAVGDEGVLAMVCDSTGAVSDGHSGSEGDLLESLTQVISECENRVAVACFATNVARVETIVRAAMANDRTVALVGRSLWRIEGAAKDVGLMADLPQFASPRDVGSIPRDKCLIICTGSQGEARSALARIAIDDHPQVALDPGDAVIFSSRVIPGNETAITRLQSNLIRKGVQVITSRDRFIHVSGHPARDELRRMYELIRPPVVIPIHGEAVHVKAQVDLARELGTEAVVAGNGSVVRLAPGEPEIVDNVPVGRLAVDGNRAVRMDGDVVRSRSRVVWKGFVVVTVVLDRKGQLAAEPQLSAPGLLGADEEDIKEFVIDAAMDAVDGLRRSSLRDEDAVKEAIRVNVRRAFRKSINKKPVVQVHLVRL